jgi:hypothetical protein
VALLPWLVLFGRCCGIWAEQLLQGGVGQHPQGPSSTHMASLHYSNIMDIFTKPVCALTDPDTLAQSTAGTRDRSKEHFADVLATMMPNNPMLAALLRSLRGGSSGSTLVVSVLKVCQVWLSGPSTSAQLTAAGYHLELLGSHLEAALRAVSAFEQQHATAADHGASAEAVLQLVQALRALRGALSTLAISSACNNPTCSNVSGPSEAGLVKGSSSACGGCRVARYCCKACQNQHWKLHKPVCKALTAARAGGIA